MADDTEPLYCDHIGDRRENANISCCYPNDQDAPACRNNIKSGAEKFHYAIFPPLQVLDRCQQPWRIFSSKLEDGEFNASGALPRLRFPLCANAPNVARYLDQGRLEPSISREVERYIQRNASDDAFKNISLAVTDCLTATCRNARNKSRCQIQCAGVNLLVNSTTPNMYGIDRCLNLLCTGGHHVYDSLPYADSDVIGIGVLSSYIMQCSLVVILFMGLTWIEFFKWNKADPFIKRNKSTPSEPTNTTTTERKVTYQSIASNYIHGRLPINETIQGRFVDLIDQFHKAQCYFSVTIQIASLRYGIFDVNMLTAFLLIPVATNGVLPVVFAYVLLLHCHKVSLGTTAMTTICWLLSSLVYWTLYSHIPIINDDILDENKRLRPYNQFVFKLSALEACGGYSALAACPANPLLEKDTIMHASRKIRVLTPIIWTFSTACLLAILGEKTLQLYRLRAKYDYSRPDIPQPVATAESDKGEASPTVFPNANDKYRCSMFDNPYIYTFVVLCFLAGTGMQLSLFSIALSLKMTNEKRWTFGQLVALTIWFPPFIAWSWNELKETVAPKVRRKVISVVTRSRV